MKIDIVPFASPMKAYIQDLDVCSMYAWSPLIIKQSKILQIFKTIHSGKSHRVKMQARKRLTLYRHAWIEYDTEEKKDWTRKYVSPNEYLASPNIELKVSFDFKSYEENKNV